MEKFFVSLNVVNLEIGGDRAENVLWRAISSPLASSVQCWTGNISTDFPCDTDDCIVDVSTNFRRNSNTINIIQCDLIPRDECWFLIK